MKKQYKIIVTVAICVAVFLCCGLTVGAERILPTSGYTTIDAASAEVIKGTETTSFPNSVYQMPFSANYFGYSGPFYFSLDVADFDVPVGYYVIFEVKSYFSSAATQGGTYTPVPSREKLLKCSVGYFADVAPGVYGMTDRGHSDHGDCYSTVVLNNNTGATLTVDAINVGVPTSGTLPAAYAYYLNVNEIRYRIMSSDEYNALMNDIETDKIVGEIQDSTDQITGEIQDSTDQITNGWEPDPEMPEGSEAVDDLKELEDELFNSTDDGLESFGSYFSSLGTILSDFMPGFMFLIGLFNRFLEIKWISSIISVCMILGLVGFLLNIASSVGASVSRAENKVRSEAKAAARRADAEQKSKQPWRNSTT